MKNDTLYLFLSAIVCFVSCTANDVVNDLPLPVKKKQFVVEVLRADFNGTITPTNVLVDSCKDATFTIVANSGYIVDVVKVNGRVITSPSLPIFVLSNVTSNINVSVGFKVDNKYMIEATSDANGTITPANQVVLPDKDAAVSIVPSAGFVVDVFKVNGSVVPLTSLTYTFSSVKSNQKAEVSFKKDLSWYLCTTKWKCDSIYERPIGEEYHVWGYFSSSYIRFSFDGTYNNSMNGKVVSNGKWSLDKSTNPCVIRWQNGGCGKIELLTERDFVVSYAQTYTDIDGTIRVSSEFKEFYSASK